MMRICIAAVSLFATVMIVAASDAQQQNRTVTANFGRAMTIAKLGHGADIIRVK
jgi:hypothetical protein